MLDFTNGTFDGSWDGFDAFAFGNKGCHVFHGVVIEFTAVGLIGVDESSVATIVGWDWSVVFDGFEVNWEHSGKSLVNDHSLVKSMGKSFGILNGGVVHNFAVEVVEVDIS